MIFYQPSKDRPNPNRPQIGSGSCFGGLDGRFGYFYKLNEIEKRKGVYPPAGIPPCGGYPPSSVPGGGEKAEKNRSDRPYRPARSGT